MQKKQYPYFSNLEQSRSRSNTRDYKQRDKSHSNDRNISINLTASSKYVDPKQYVGIINLKYS